MRERLSQLSRSMHAGRSGGRGGRIRLRASHRRIASLRGIHISHSRPGAWEPPVKDADRDEVVPRRQAGKKR